MKRFRGQLGQINAGCLIAVVILAVVTVVGVKTVPVMINVGEMQKEVEFVAERANVVGYTNKRIKNRLRRRAEVLHLPVAPENIEVRRNSQYVDIKVTYDLEIKYPLYTYHWHKVHTATGRLF